MLALQGAQRLHKFAAMCLLTLAAAAGMTPRVRAGEGIRLPEKAKLHFIQNKTIFVGDLTLHEREGEEFFLGTREGALDRELKLTVAASLKGDRLTMSYVNYHRGEVETRGYVNFQSETIKHATLGEGLQGILVQTHQRVDGRLTPKRQSARVFMQFETLPDDVVIEGPAEEPEPRFTAPRPQPDVEPQISKAPAPEMDRPAPPPAPLSRDEDDEPSSPQPGPRPDVEPEDESNEPAPLPLPPSTPPEGRAFRH